MPNFELITVDDLEKKVCNSQLCLQREALTLNGTTSAKPIILTSGIATCVVCIIYDPESKFTIFSHIDETVNIETSQSKLVDKLKARGINLANVKIILAGGRKSHPSSRQHAINVKSFWQKNTNPNNINDELLLCRDCLSVDSEEAKRYLDQTATSSEIIEYNNYLSFVSKKGKEDDGVDNSYIYLDQKRSTPVARKIADALINLCINKKILGESDKSRFLVGVQAVIDEGGGKILIDLQVFEKSLIPLVGFDSKTGQLFIVNDLCIEIVIWLIQNSCIEERWNESMGSTIDQEFLHLKEIKDEFDVCNKYQASSPLDEHKLQLLRQRNARVHNSFLEI